MVDDPLRAERLQGALRYRFRDFELLRTALTHRSHSYEGGAGGRDYERLEFLGDALLGFVVAEWLFRHDTAATEGSLTRRRQAVVRTSTLAEAIRLGRGEERTGGRTKASLLADAFEAVLGAVYLDGGIRPARAFVARHLGPRLRATSGGRAAHDDYKTRLQEATQARLQRTPGYRIVSTTGPDHALRFEVEVTVEGRVVGRGAGTSRKKAEQEAARSALDALERRNESVSPEAADDA